MSRPFAAALLSVAAVACVGIADDSARNATSTSSKAALSDATTSGAESEIAAIQKSIDSYVAAFNRGDAKSVAAHWTERGDYLTPAGERWQGRPQIAEKLAAYFARAKGGKLELIDAQVTIQSPSVATETGTARLISPDGESSDTQYQATHVRTSEGWRIDSVREEEAPVAPPSHYEQLKELGWMVGRWADSDGKSNVETSCRWSANENFLIQTFKVADERGVDFQGTQVIGWDPHANSIRSWVFDSDGGFGVGKWSGGSGRWTVQTLSVLPDGRRGSATNVYEVLDENRVQYRSIGRQVEGELLPSVGPLTVVRAKQE